MPYLKLLRIQVKGVNPIVSTFVIRTVSKKPCNLLISMCQVSFPFIVNCFKEYIAN